MNYDELVLKVTQAVMQKLSQPEILPQKSDKPLLLILAQEHGDICHSGLEDVNINLLYTTHCAKKLNYDCDVAKYDALVLYDMTVENLVKLACAIADTPYQKIASKAMLLGKKLYVINSTVELFSYKTTANENYYNMLYKHVEFLKSCGVNFVDSFVPSKSATKLQTKGKRLLTEKDVNVAVQAGQNELFVSQKCIVTALAQETAANCKLKITRE